MPFESDPVILSLLSAKIYRTALVSTAPEILLPVFISRHQIIWENVYVWKSFSSTLYYATDDLIKSEMGRRGGETKNGVKNCKACRLLKGNWVTFYWQTALHKMR